MEKLPFKQRFNIDKTKPIVNDFPETARIALYYLINDLIVRKYFGNDSNNALVKVVNELYRVSRNRKPEFFEQLDDILMESLLSMEWTMIYTFCERVYERLLKRVSRMHSYETGSEWVEVVSIAEVRQYYSDELNNLLAEENISYQFVDGQFLRKGRAQTQKNIQRAGAVLSDSSLSRVRNHFNKALKFYDSRPDPDVENCIKEALCALEACIEIKTKKPASKEFTKVIKQLTGNDEIPGPIGEGMIKLYALRGSGEGIAHAAPEGVKVTELEAELVLSLVATYITYVADLFIESEDEIPF